ncbi:contractile injection system protein, VgrG/Pvc8 family [Eionea flava]
MVDSFPPFNIESLDVDHQLAIIEIESDANRETIGSQYIRVHSIQGQESVSQPFQLSVELRADDTSNAGALLDAHYMGHWAKITIAMPEEGDFTPRFFRGVITEIAVGAPGIYTLTLQSPLHLLTLRNNYYIYSGCDIRELITRLLEHELQDPRFALRFDLSDSPTLTRTQDWMQAGESSMDMLQRILAKAFLNYFFIHEESRLVLVFSDKTLTPDTVSIPGFHHGPLPLRYTFSSVEPLRSQQYDVFANLRYSVKMMPAKVQTLLSQVDPQWKDNTVANFNSYSAQDNSASSTVGFQHYWNYDYGVNDNEAKDQQRKIAQQISTETGTLTGSVYNPLLSPGYCFQLFNPLLDKSDNAEKVEGKGRPEFDQKIYVVTKIEHKFSGETGYTGSIESTEVVTKGDETEKTFLTPFSMHSTQQGSVLAKVLDHEKPVGWRYRSKNNFQPEKGQVFFEGNLEHNGECHGEAGCLVQLATGQKHWVVLPRSSQSVPEINSMVMIGRGSNESEQPELQQVLASHGSKVIQPPDRRNASWQANTNWGSSYSTSYGDNMSIHFGHMAQTNLPQAVRLVEGAYDNIGMAGTQYGSTSYNKGGSWSVSLSGNEANPDVGVIGASISQGSSFGESHTAHSYNYGSTKVSEGYSETGKSANVSVVGKYTPSPDLQNPSFINGKLPKDISEYTDELSNGDTFSRSSVLGRSINCNGVGISAPDVSIGSLIPGTHYNSSITLGISENISKTLGATFNDSLMVGMSFSNSITCAAQFSNSLTIGAIMNIDTRIAGTTSLSTTIGPSFNYGLQIADTFSQSTTIGSSTNMQTNLTDTKNISTTIGSATDASTYIGAKNSTSTFVGATNDVSVNVANRNSSSVTVGASNESSVNVAAKKSTNVFVGATDDTSINVAARKSTSISVGVSDDTSISLAASNSTNVSIAAKADTSLNIGASTSMSLNLSASVALTNTLSASASITNTASASVELINSLAATAKIINQASVDFEMINGVTKAESDLRQQAKLRATIAEVVSGMDLKV